MSEVQEETAPVSPVRGLPLNGISPARAENIARAAHARKIGLEKYHERKRLAAEDLAGLKRKLHPYGRIDINFIKAAERLKAAGLSDDDLVWVFGLSNRKLIQNWKLDDPAFREACLRGKEMVKRHLVAAGFKAAIGYDYSDSVERYTIDKETGKSLFVGRTVYKRHCPPDITALTFLLCNLDKKWRSPTKLEVRNEMKTLNVTLDGNLDSKRIEQLARKLLPPDTEDAPRKFVMAAEVSNGAGG